MHPNNLIDEFFYDQEKVSKFIGKSRSHITNSLRLLTLPLDVIKLIETQKLTAGHAKILVGLENSSFVANKIVEKKLSVRQAENFVQLFKKKRQKSKITKDTNIIALELSVSNKIGLNVEIQIFNLAGRRTVQDQFDSCLRLKTHIISTQS